MISFLPVLVDVSVRANFLPLLDNFQDVVFPSITICNLNQVEASFLKDLGIFGNNMMTKILFDEAN